MKTLIALSLAAASTTAFVCFQPGGEPPPRDTVFVLFDTDQNGEISMKEIDAAAAILKKRDVDNSGALTRDELPRPPRPPRRGESDQGDGRPGPPPPRDGEHGEERGSGGGQQRPPMDDDTDAVPGTVFFGGGYETKSVDKGRPVVLIAAALGVTEQVFRDAFSKVNPSSSGPPSRARAQANKKVLMDALGKHGITNERLDEVSNYYRYQSEADELWTVTPAKAAAVIKEGTVTGFEIINAGSGYSSAPEISVADHPDVRVKATIEFTKDLRTNGRVTKFTIIK